MNWEYLWYEFFFASINTFKKELFQAISEVATWKLEDANRTYLSHSQASSTLVATGTLPRH